MTEEMTAVVVEDDPEVRLGSVQALEIAGIRTVPLSAAEQALEIVQPGFRGIVVTDIRLPGRDGLSLLRELKRLDPALPVIVITGHGDVQTAVVAMRAGAADFLEKPFSSKDSRRSPSRRCSRGAPTSQHANSAMRPSASKRKSSAVRN